MWGPLSPDQSSAKIVGFGVKLHEVGHRYPPVLASPHISLESLRAFTARTEVEMKMMYG